MSRIFLKNVNLEKVRCQVENNFEDTLLKNTETSEKKIKEF